MSPRWACKVDTVSAACIAEFRLWGADWLDLSRGPGIDGLALYHGKVYLIEIKTARSPKTGRVRMTKTQNELARRGWPVRVIRSPEEVRRVLGVEEVWGNQWKGQEER